jgi:iron complex outermembrane recepter protein
VLFRSLTLSDNKFIDFVDDGKDYSNNKLPGVPSFTINVGLNFSYNKGFYSNFLYYHTGMQYIDDGNTANYKAWSLANIKTGYRIKGRKQFSSNFYLGIQNLFNQHYAAMLLVNAPSFGGVAPRYFYPGQERAFYGGISIGF